MFFLCTPVYALALGTLLLFAPPFGLVQVPYFFDPNSYAPPQESPWDFIRSMIVPWLVVGAPLAGAILRLTLALTRASENGWGSAQTLGLLGGGVAALIAFLVIEHVQARPVLELSLLRRPSFSGVLIGSLLLTAAAFAYLTYVSLWLQSVRGLTPIEDRCR